MNDFELTVRDLYSIGKTFHLPIILPQTVIK